MIDNDFPPAVYEVLSQLQKLGSTRVKYVKFRQLDLDLDVYGCVLELCQYEGLVSFEGYCKPSPVGIVNENGVVTTEFYIGGGILPRGAYEFGDSVREQVEADLKRSDDDDVLHLRITRLGEEALAIHRAWNVGRPAAGQGNEAGARKTAPAPLFSDDARVTHVELAKYFGLNSETVRKRLDYWRATNDGWREINDRKSREPKYLYEFGKVKHLFSGEVSGESPAKK